MTKIASWKIGLIAVVFDVLLSAPFLIATHVRTGIDVDDVHNFTGWFSPLWATAHSPLEGWIVHLLFPPLTEIGAQFSVWKSALYFGVCFFQTFLVFFCIHFFAKKLWEIWREPN